MLTLPPSVSGPHQRYKYCLKLYSFVFPLSPNLGSAFYFFTFIKSGLLENMNKK